MMRFLAISPYILNCADFLQLVGRDSIDWVVSGMTGLLHWCIQLMKSKKRPLNVE